MIATATTEDIDRLVELWVALMETGQADGGHLDPTANDAIARQRIAAAVADDRVLLARPEDSIVGFASVTLEHGVFEMDCPRGIVENLYVVPSARRQGVGTALLAAAEARLRELGADVVAVETLAANEAGRAFYRAQGYRPHRVTLERRVESDRKGDPPR